MPRSRSPENYPQEYLGIVRDCGLNGKQLRLPAAGPMPGDDAVKKLMKLRGHFYAFVGAVKKAGLTDEKWKDVSNWAAQTSVWLDSENRCLVFSNRSMSWQATLVRETIGVIGQRITGGETGFTPAAVDKSLPGTVDLEADESLARILAATQGGEKK